MYVNMLQQRELALANLQVSKIIQGGHTPMG
jgi:hypothetical protein